MFAMRHFALSCVFPPGARDFGTEEVDIFFIDVLVCLVCLGGTSVSRCT